MGCTSSKVIFNDYLFELYGDSNNIYVTSKGHVLVKSRPEQGNYLYFYPAKVYYKGKEYCFLPETDKNGNWQGDIMVKFKKYKEGKYKFKSVSPHLTFEHYDSGILGHTKAQGRKIEQNNQEKWEQANISVALLLKAFKNDKLRYPHEDN